MISKQEINQISKKLKDILRAIKSGNLDHSESKLKKNTYIHLKSLKSALLKLKIIMKNTISKL